MATVDVIDEIFVVAEPAEVRRVMCERARWRAWFPDLRLTPYDDRGLLGVRWHLDGALNGTAEVWLEEFGDGVIVHVYIRAESTERQQAGRLRRRYVLPLKRHLTAVKDALEADRAPGDPRVPVAERVVSPPVEKGLDEPDHRDRPSDRAKGLRDMANETTSSIVIDADPAHVMAVIADFESYPSWAKGVKSAEVLTEYEDGRAGEVAFVLDAAPIKDEYTLTYDWQGDAQVSWSLVEAKMLRAMEGAYLLEPREDTTEVTYQLAVELSIPMIGMLRRKGEKVIIDTALKGLKKRVESLG